jgi:hypothetical protein
VDAALPDLDAAARFTFLAMDVLQPLVQWTVLGHQGTLDRLEPHWYGFGNGEQDNRTGFERWLAAPTVDTMVVLDRPSGPPAYRLTPTVLLHCELRDLLATQRTFQLTKRQEFPEQGIEVQVWKRNRQVATCLP